MKMIELELGQPIHELEIADVGAYLECAATLVIAAGRDHDVLDPSRGGVVPIGVATDGTFGWPLSLSYYVKEHQVGLPRELLSHMRSQSFDPPVLDSSSVAELREELREAMASIVDPARFVVEIPAGAQAGDDAWG